MCTDSPTSGVAAVRRQKRKYSEREQNPNLKGSVRCRPEWYQLYTAVGLLWKVPVELLFEDVGFWQSVDTCLLSVVCHAIASAHAVITLREVGAICEHSHRDSTSMQVPDMSACRLSELPLGRAQGVLMR